jgi:hypothetical protein
MPGSIFAGLPAPITEAVMAIRAVLARRRALMAAEGPLGVHDIRRCRCVAGVAGRDSRVVHRKRCKRCGADMAQVAVGVASRRQRYMQSVRVVHGAFRCRSVVAGSADPGNVAIVETCSQPRDGIEMADIAVGRGGDVGCTLPRCNGQAVVASHAYARR